MQKFRAFSVLAIAQNRRRAFHRLGEDVAIGLYAQKQLGRKAQMPRRATIHCGRHTRQHAIRHLLTLAQTRVQTRGFAIGLARPRGGVIDLVDIATGNRRVYGRYVRQILGLADLAVQSGDACGHRRSVLPRQGGIGVCEHLAAFEPQQIKRSGRAPKHQLHPKVIRLPQHHMQTLRPALLEQGIDLVQIGRLDGIDVAEILVITAGVAVGIV